MQNSTDWPSITTEFPTSSCVTTSVPSTADHQIEVWQVAVPLTIVITSVLIGTAGLALAIAAYKIHRWQHSRVLPASVRTSEGESHHHETRVNGWSESKNINLETTLTSVHGSDEFEVTRTKSLTVLIPRGKKLEDMFVATDIEEFKEPDVIDGGLRWQVIQLDTSNQRSEISLSSSTQTEDCTVMEVVYRQGVYLKWNDTLSDLRNAFIDTNQLDSEDKHFLFLKTDMLGEYIEVESEKVLCLNRLHPSVTRNHTVYIESVDSGSVQDVLCGCGRHTQYLCSHCQNKGYCSEACQEEDLANHRPVCSNTQTNCTDSHVQFQIGLA